MIITPPGVTGPPMARGFAYAAALAVVISAGIVNGVLTGRWTTSTGLRDRVAALDRVPMVVGDWAGHASDLDRRTIEQAGIKGYLLRRYENRRLGAAVTVLLVCGRPGPISVHTPEVCYSGIGYEPESATSKRVIAVAGSPRPDEFWVTNLVKPGPAAAEHLRIFYSWGNDGTWHASERPRLEFGGSEALYKLYVIRATSGVDVPREGDVGAEFVRQLLPELRKALPAKD